MKKEARHLTPTGEVLLPPSSSRPQEEEEPKQARGELSDELQALIFPKRLMKFLNSDDYRDVVRWSPDGKSFVVVDKSEFVAKLLPKFSSRKSKFTSFLRKLNRWGFSRLLSGPNAGAYHHEFFVRDRPQLASQMYYHNQRAKAAMYSKPGSADSQRPLVASSSDQRKNNATSAPLLFQSDTTRATRASLVPTDQQLRSDRYSSLDDPAMPRLEEKTSFNDQQFVLAEGRGVLGSQKGNSKAHRDRPTPPPHTDDSFTNRTPMETRAWGHDIIARFLPQGSTPVVLPQQVTSSLEAGTYTQLPLLHQGHSPLLHVGRGGGRSFPNDLSLSGGNLGISDVDALYAAHIGNREKALTAIMHLTNPNLFVRPFDPTQVLIPFPPDLVPQQHPAVLLPQVRKYLSTRGAVGHVYYGIDGAGCETMQTNRKSSSVPASSEFFSGGVQGNTLLSPPQPAPSTVNRRREIPSTIRAQDNGENKQRPADAPLSETNEASSTQAEMLLHSTTPAASSRSDDT